MWRDTWALVVVKGGEGGVVGEDVGKSPNVQTWGTPVNLRVTVPLTDDGQLHNNTHTNIEYIVNVHCH